MYLKKLILSIVLLGLLVACAPQPQQVVDAFNRKKIALRNRLITDTALEVFHMELVPGRQWVLEGRTTVPAAAEGIRLITDSLLGAGSYADNLRLLPDTALGDSLYGVVIVSVTPLRREGRHASEMLDQVIMGNELKLLQKGHGWYLVKNHYGYVGWVNKTAFQRLDKAGLNAWHNAKKMQVKKLLSFVYEKPSFKARHLSDLVLNSVLEVGAKKGHWVQVKLADGESGWVPANHLQEIVVNRDPQKVAASAILETAYSMLGVPYLWGGKSSKASDCSGFTQTVFRANGIQLPRDARQQALLGETIDAAEDFSNVQPADLLFFGSGKRITHVGISLGGYDFIHQDSDVHIDSFNPQAENFNAFRKRTLKIIKRIL